MDRERNGWNTFKFITGEGKVPGFITRNFGKNHMFHGDEAEMFWGMWSYFPDNLDEILSSTHYNIGSNSTIKTLTKK